MACSRIVKLYIKWTNYNLKLIKINRACKPKCEHLNRSHNAFHELINVIRPN